MTETAEAGPAQAALMNRTYRRQRLIYDATRKYFLLGRDQLIAGLAPPAGASVLEIACGTGRNLDVIARRYPGRRLYGLDISAEMLRTARAKLGPKAQLAEADACSFAAPGLFGMPQFDRIVLSYSLSMIPDWQAALANAADHLAPGGELHIVDFGPQDRLPAWFRTGLARWLARFHVAPRRDLAAATARLAAAHGATADSQTLFRDYATYARLRAA